jgi:hypothetical protein
MGYGSLREFKKVENAGRMPALPKRKADSSREKRAMAKSTSLRHAMAQGTSLRSG